APVVVRFIHLSRRTDAQSSVFRREGFRCAHLWSRAPRGNGFSAPSAGDARAFRATTRWPGGVKSAGRQIRSPEPKKVKHWSSITRPTAPSNQCWAIRFQPVNGCWWGIRSAASIPTRRSIAISSRLSATRHHDRLHRRRHALRNRRGKSEIAVTKQFGTALHSLERVRRPFVGRQLAERLHVCPDVYQNFNK